MKCEAASPSQIDSLEHLPVKRDFQGLRHSRAKTNRDKLPWDKYCLVKIYANISASTCTVDETDGKKK